MKNKKYLLILFLTGFCLSTKAQFKLSFKIKKDSTEVQELEKVESGFFSKALKTLKAVKQVVNDPSSIEVNLKTKKGKEESLKDFLKRKNLLRQDASLKPATQTTILI